MTDPSKTEQIEGYRLVIQLVELNHRNDLKSLMDLMGTMSASEMAFALGCFAHLITTIMETVGVGVETWLRDMREVVDQMDTGD